MKIQIGLPAQISANYIHLIVYLQVQKYGQVTDHVVREFLYTSLYM